MKKNIASFLRLSLLIALFALAQTPVPVAQAQAGTPQLILTKTVDDNVTIAQVSDVIRYRIRWECSSLTTACGIMEITDVLQAGLTYLPPPNSSVPSGFQITYNGVTRTVTITKTDNNLLDGTQFDAVIAVRVDNDLRPLPTTIDNTVNGRVDPPGPVGWTNATPASAPPITIGTVSPSWELTKTRVAPVIEPTINTDVTYQLRLCPVPPPTGGIAALTNILLTDTLPANAVFVSASDGGTFVGGVATWPTVAGPLLPPDCITRLVTMRYPSPPFNINDTLTNSANVTAGYIDSLGNPCPNCFAPPATLITHNIIPIADVPTYSKGDAGDPVGITGTARFILNLNTNLTNYPANAVTLIDNLPGQLQVTSVTSGTWNADFDNVRAYVEYSTNYGSTWVAFSGQPVSYNTNATYTAPVNNITNVRWRFEYDQDRDGTYAPGLPYVWQFSSNPEIRVTPRATATVADPPSGVFMPAAMVGSTYANCVQVSRVGQGGPVTDPCSNQDMTVRGNYASLQVIKNETPGTPWDEWDDPNINTFVSDATILPGDTLRYVLTVDMTERSSAALIDPTVLDILPDDLVFVRVGTVELNGGPLPGGASYIFTRSGPNPGGLPPPGQTLRWDFSGLNLPPQALGSRVLTMEFFARIPRGQLPGARTNTLQVATDSSDILCEIGTQPADTSDLDGDGNTAEFTCRNTDNYVVDRSAALRGEKWIRSVAAVNNQVVDSTTFLPDASCPNGGTSGLPGSSNPFTRFPCISQAYPEGALNPGQYTSPPSGAADLDDFEYQLRVFNDGNVPMLNYVLYDILPFYGDRGSGGTLFSSPRSSEFRPVMTGPIQFLGGAGLVAGNFTIEYNLTTNPCRPEVFNQTSGTIPAGCSDTWISSAATAGWTASDWATVRSYRIRLNSGFTIAPYIEGDPTNIVRFGLLLSIPADSPVVGVFNNDDAQSREIAWNSFAHVGSYQDLSSAIRDLLASEPRKVGITIPERFSIGNRVWRDSDNSGTINPPDDTNPGIAGVLVQLYLSSNTTTPIATTTTDTGGYYLFSNLPEGDYVVGIPASNFDIVGDPLFNLRSSTGTPASATYTNPPETNPDREDHGRDPATLGQEVFSAVITLSRTTEQSGETDLSSNNRDGPAGTRRGLNGERDYNSDLTVDFGFFGGTDVPFSIGNHLWYDDGTGGGVLNDGIRQAGELPVVGATLYIYRDGNANGIPDAGERILNRSDVTDAGGFYLFDNLDPGTYFIQVVPANFDTVGDPLDGWFSSQPTGTEMLGVNGGTSTADLDNDDNGVNTDFPDTRGVFSGPVVLMRNGLPSDQEPLGETHLSGQLDPGPPTNDDFDPTGWDGPTPGSRGRFGETDATSNLTIDFGFIPPMSLGNRVWFDNGSTTGGLVLSQYNDGIMNGNEAGVNGVRVELYRDTNGDGILQPGEFIRATTTDATGYYLFEYLQPAVNYYIHIPNDNFGNTGAGDLVSTDPLLSHLSSNGGAVPADDATDINDNGIDNANPLANGITSQVIGMAYGSEPTTPPESDISPNVAVYGTGNVGRQGQTDASSNLTMDFGFIQPPRSIGNRLWFDDNNNGIMDGGEAPVVGARVSLYSDSDNNGIPDGPAIATDITDSITTPGTGGFYLFGNLPSGRYLVGVDFTNFQSGQPLFEYASSSGNQTNNTDINDNGIDRILPGDVTASPYGVLSNNINLTIAAPSGETDLSNNPADGAPGYRGTQGETDANSDLTIDFGFARPMSLGNRVFRDDGAAAGHLNNGIMDADESPIANVRVELYRDNGNGTFGVEDGAAIRFDNTDTGGYYLFDNLPAGNYFVHIPAVEFQSGGDLFGFNNSTPGGAENVQVPGNELVHTPITDSDDNGVYNTRPDNNGVTSGLITLALTTEPAGETEISGQANPANGTEDDLDPTGWDGPTPGSRGRFGETDSNSNLTVDFGFVPVYSLGNRAWLDTGGTTGTPNNGVMDGDEAGINGLTVRLYLDSNNDGTPDGASIFTTTTDTNGYYRFDNLIAGTYIVEVVPPAGLGSTVDTNQDPDNNTDLDDNGVIVLVSGEVRSRPVTLGDLPEPTGEEPTPPNPDSANGEAPDAQSNRTVDFGFVGAVAIGNVIWYDTGAAAGHYNNGIFDTDETGVNGVIVELYNATTNTKVVTGPDGIPNSGDESLGDVVTSSSGYYRFDQLIPGNYYVRIPASEFQAGRPLYTYLSSSDSVPATTSQTADNNADENGIDGTPANPLTVTGIRTLTYTLTPGTMPVADDDTFYTGTLSDNSVNFTADFGFVESYSLGNRVWLDTNRDGLRNDGVEPGIRDVTVNLYRDTNNDGTPDGPIVHTVLTDVDGYYRFDHLIADTYIVEVTIPTGGYASTLNAGDPDLDTDDDDDNGVLLVVVGTENRVRSDPVTLEPRTNSEPQTEGNPVTNPEAGEAPNARSNRTVDFGFFASNAISNKQLTGTIIMDTDPVTGNPVVGTDFTSGTQVAIGEILTYQIQLEVPSGETFTNLRAVDELNPGLAFVGCDSIVASNPGLTTTLPAFADACNSPTNPTVAPQSTPESQNDANLVTFSLGNVTNGTATTQTVTITYRVIVLDIPLNRNGGTNVLNNKATWLWLGTNLPPVLATPVQVVEPKLSVDKKATPTSAPYGSNIRFTIDIAHTAASAIDAFDVVVTDILPPGLQYVAGSASFAGLAPNTPTPPADYYDAATSTLTFNWAVFPLGETATITFLATFVGPAPVVNSANVAWTSLPIDPQPNGQPVRLSPYNDFSTERWYDPADLTGLNAYIASDSVTIELPSRTLPATGFAPNVETQILPQPLNMKYAATDILLEIPSLGIKLPIVGVPKKNGTWDVTWLGKQAGWLEGSAFPSWSGNSVLTSHVYQSNGLPGPFVNLNTLKYGDKVIVHAYGQKYIFDVRANSVVEPNDVTVFKHEEKAWLTLITCKEYDEKTNTYKKRVVVRAVLVSVDWE